MGHLEGYGLYRLRKIAFRRKAGASPTHKAGRISAGLHMLRKIALRREAGVFNPRIQRAKIKAGFSPGVLLSGEFTHGSPSFCSLFSPRG
jgi:hypothetical protein